MRNPILLFFILNFFMAGARPPKGYCVHPDGMYYQVFHLAKDSAHPVYGDYIFMHLVKQHPNEKEIFDTHMFNENGVELSLEKPKHIPDVTEIFLEMSAGDSAVVKIPASKIDSNAGDNNYYTYYLKLINFKSKEDYESEKSRTADNQRKTDDSLIADYVKGHFIEHTTTDSLGIVIQKTIITNESLLQKGDTIRMHYIGSLLNGSEFDNSLNRNQPLVFVAGKKQVIDGMDIGLQYFRRGEKGLIIIPSYLGYADKETGKIPPNSVLVFYVEFLP